MRAPPSSSGVFAPAGALLGVEAALKLNPIAAKNAFPEAQAEALRVTGRPASVNGNLVAYARSDQKRLAAWYRAGGTPHAESDSDPEGRALRATGSPELSVAGFRPDHLAFDPFPLEAMLHPRLRGSLDDLVLGPMKPLAKLRSTASHYPWCTVGVVMRSYPPYTDEHRWGSGFVFGGRVMLTARHLFPRKIHDSFKDGTRYRFIPGYNPRASDPEPFGSARVLTVRGKATDSSSFFADGFWGVVNGWDYAACRLDQRIGDLCGGMGVYSFGRADAYKNRYYNSAGYPSYNQGVPVQEILAQVRDVDGGNYERELETVNFAAPGWSGGPLFGYLNESGDTRAVAVCSGSEWFDSLLPPYNNCVWAGGKRFVDLARYTVAHWWD